MDVLIEVVAQSVAHTVRCETAAATRLAAEGLIIEREPLGALVLALSSVPVALFFKERKNTRAEQQRCVSKRKRRCVTTGRAVRRV